VLQEISEFAKIKAMPTFIAYKAGQPLATVTGAKPAELKVSAYHYDVEYLLLKQFLLFDYQDAISKAAAAV
jgi:hypothetical protein